MKITGKFISGEGLGTPDFKATIELSPEELATQLTFEEAFQILLYQRLWSCGVLVKTLNCALTMG
jgi:hypothetical protein